MMNYKIAICDDSEADRQFIVGMIEKWAAKAGHSFCVSEYSSAEEFLFHYEDEKNYDILLLDVEMGEMDGVELAQKIRKEDETVQIVFITGYSDYIAEGYEVAALHYLMKPVKPEKMMTVLDRAVDKIRKNEAVLCLDAGGERIRMPLYQIRYVDVNKNYITVHGKTDVTVKQTLGELETFLSDDFFRVGRSAIVNLRQINRVTKTDIYLQDGTIIPLPRGAYEKVNRAIIEMK